MGKKRANGTDIYAVASKAGVSIATVSRALNHPEKVKEETRNRVLKEIDKIGYHRSRIALSLTGNTSTFIGLIVPDFSRASVAELINAICNSSRRYDYQVMVFLAENDKREKVDVWKDVKESQVDGVIYCVDLDNPIDRENIPKLRNRDTRIPIVSAGTLINNTENIINVNMDYFKGAKEVTEKLIKKGKKHIIFATTNRLYPMNEEKQKGYLEAMREANLEPVTFETSGKTSINKNMIKDFLDEKPLIDGIVGARDSITISLMNALLDNGYKVPDDIEIYSMQNTKSGKLVRPTLSCVSASVEEIADRSLEKLTELMDAMSSDDIHDENERDRIIDELYKKNSVYVDYDIIERGSTK